MEKIDTKVKIYRAAAELFSKQGYYNVSVSEICNAAGVTKPSMYYYFKDKEDLLLALANEAHDIIEQLTYTYLSETKPFLENLDNLNTLFLRYTREYTYLIPFSFLVQFTPVPQKIKDIMNSRILSRWNFLNSIFVKGQKEGYLDKKLDSNLLMRSLFNPLSVIVVQHVLSEYADKPLEVSIKEYFKFWKDQFLKKL